MATTIHEPLRAEKQPSGNGGGGWKNMAPAGGHLPDLMDYNPQAAQTGMWVVVAAVTMMFAALTSALVVRQHTGNDWQHIALPSILLWNTLVLLASSATLEFASRGPLRRLRGNVAITVSRPWLYATSALGLLFVVGQYVAWTELRAAGLYLATNPNSSFFYVLTALHAVHILGGLIGLSYVMSKERRGVLRPSTLAAAVFYWHFMGGVWIYLGCLLWVKL